jgi:putative tributyrin esterase
MGIMRFNYRSQAIGRYIDISVVYPTDNMSYIDPALEKKHPVPGPEKQQYKPGMKFQTVYLIHGGGDDDSLVYRYTNAEYFAQRNCVMLVTPDITNSFGINTNYEVEYSTFLNEELPIVIQTLFASSPKREDNFIVGYAMGGNAAFGNALMYPQNYSTCVDMSGGIGLTVNMQTLKDELNSEHFKNDFKLYGASFGEADKLDGSRHDMYTLAKKNLENGVEVPKFYFIAGSEESFIRDRCKDDADILKSLGYDATYIEAEGYKHDFEMWDKYLHIVFDEILPLKRKAIYSE